MKRINFNSEKCMNCGFCELACAVAHSTNKDIIECFREFDGLPSRIEINKIDSNNIEANFCHNCEYPPCEEICITGAITKKEGYVNYDTKKCVACWSCIMACPFDAIKANSEGNHTIRCDGCRDWTNPVCVQICPTGALCFEEPEKQPIKKRINYGRYLAQKYYIDK